MEGYLSGLPRVGVMPLGHDFGTTNFPTMEREFDQTEFYGRGRVSLPLAQFKPSGAGEPSPYKRLVMDEI